MVKDTRQDGLRSPEMSAVGNPIEDYVLGNTAQEQERLKLQGRFLAKWTEQFPLSAGIVGVPQILASTPLVRITSILLSLALTHGATCELGAVRQNSYPNKIRRSTA